MQFGILRGRLGCSRNTVKRYLKEADASRYGPRQARVTKLDPFKAYVLERIEAARPHWIPAAVLHREIGELGYSGGLTQLKMFVTPYKRIEAEPVTRFAANLAGLSAVYTKCAAAHLVYCTNPLTRESPLAALVVTRGRRACLRCRSLLTPR